MPDGADRSKVHQRLLAEGRPAMARILGLRTAGGGEVRFELAVEIDGEWHEVVHQQAISGAALGAMRLGSEVPVRLDPESPGTLMIA
jgi:hypothetical protein